MLVSSAFRGHTVCFSSVYSVFVQYFLAPATVIFQCIEEYSSMYPIDSSKRRCSRFFLRAVSIGELVPVFSWLEDHVHSHGMCNEVVKELIVRRVGINCPQLVSRETIPDRGLTAVLWIGKEKIIGKESLFSVQKRRKPLECAREQIKQRGRTGNGMFREGN